MIRRILQNALNRKWGRFKVILLYYRRVSESLKGTELTLRQLQSFLDANAGIKVYRDKIRVMPYGDLRNSEGGDWLGLETENPVIQRVLDEKIFEYQQTK